jgi:DNA-binding PadR family transcriptional regulator
MGRFMGITSITILATLEGHRCYGLDIIDRTALLAGTVYTTLRRLEARGLVAGQWEDADVAQAERRPRRRYYTLTTAGAAELAVARGRLAGVVSGADVDDPVGEAPGA